MKSIALLALLIALPAAILPAADAIPITVTGRALTINGATAIPRGLFGVHAVPLTDERVADWGIEMDRIINHTPGGTNAVIDGIRTETDAKGKTRTLGRPKALSSVVECLYDRFQPAVRIPRKDGREFLADIGKKYGEHARTTGQQHYIEFWNEPYLNWATRPAVNYHGLYYDQTAAQPGQPMKLLTTGEEFPGLVWDRQIFFTLKPGNKQVDYFTSGYLPREGQPGETVKLRFGIGEVTLTDGAEIKLFGPRLLSLEWSGKDLSQKYYWSGEVNRRFYIEMFEAFGRSLKETNPDVKLAAGWGFNFFNENWAVWDMLIRPTIDACHPWFDALHEHHYGSDTRMVAASYEVAYAYTLAGHEHHQNDDFECALQCFRGALKCQPRHYQAWYGLGMVFQKQERLSSAE